MTATWSWHDDTSSEDKVVNSRDFARQGKGISNQSQIFSLWPWPEKYCTATAIIAHTPSEMVVY